jgi:hypothetical protein
LHEQGHSFGIVVIGSPVQRGGPIDLGGVYVDACPEELADAGLVALFRGVGEWGAPRRESWAGEAGPQQYESTYVSPVHARLLPNVNSLEEVFDFSGTVHE